MKIVITLATLSAMSLRGASAACGDVKTIASITGDPSSCNYANFLAALGTTGECTEDEIFALLGVSEDAGEREEYVDELCAYDALVQFVEIQGTYQLDRRYFAGGGPLVDGGDDWATRSWKIQNFHNNMGDSTIISWPEYLARIDYNAGVDGNGNPLNPEGQSDNGYPANMNLDVSCALQTAMCCFVDDSNGPSPDDFASVVTTDVCRHDLENSRQSNNINRGWSVFPGAEKPVHCTGFTWDDETTDLIGNLMYDASLSLTVTKGYLKAIPGAPMCGCVEHMPVVEKAACRKAKVADGTDVTFTFNYADGDLSAENEASIVYEDCDGDLKAEYQAVHADNADAIDAHLVGDGGCEADIVDYLNEEQFLHVGVSPTRYLDVNATGGSWSDLLVGEGTRFMPADLDIVKSDAEFRAMFSACLPTKQRFCMLRRVCDSCTTLSHRDIYYQRIGTTVDDLPKGYGGAVDEEGDPIFDVDNGETNLQELFTDMWMSANNTLGVNFNLYSSYVDALSGDGAWTWCNYDHKGVGFPRDCGPTGPVHNNWNSYKKFGHGYANYHGYYIELP